MQMTALGSTSTPENSTPGGMVLDRGGPPSHNCLLRGGLTSILVSVILIRSKQRLTWNLTDEIQTLRTNLKQARQEHQALEGQLRELRSSETATRFKLDSLSQQLQLSQEHGERMTNDLNAKVEEFANYRRTKHAELAQLQGAHDSFAQKANTTESQLKALQAAHAAQSHQLTQALSRVQSLQGQLAEQEVTFSSEASSLKRLVEMMEAREAQAKAIVEGIEQDYAGISERAGRREAALKDEIEEQRQRAEQAEKRIEELEAVMERLDRGEFPMPSFTAEGLQGTPRTPARTPGMMSMMNATPDFLSQSIMGLSPTVAMASRVQRNGKTFTEVYADYVRLQEDYARKSAEFDNMDRTLSAVLAQIEERVCGLLYLSRLRINSWYTGAHPFSTTRRVRTLTTGVRAIGVSAFTGARGTRYVCSIFGGARAEAGKELAGEHPPPEAAG